MGDRADGNVGIGSAPPPRPDVAEQTSRLRTAVRTIAAVAPPALAFVLPFLGPAASLSAPFVAGGLGVRVWPAPRRKIVGASVLVLVGVWAATIGVASSPSGNVDALWLLLPLCSPTGAVGFWLPPLVATAGYAIVTAISIRTRRVWIWPIAGIVAGAAYSGTWILIEESVRWIC